MDSERFGRALGFGARAAAKTLAKAADAAAAPNPKAATKTTSGRAEPTVESPRRAAQATEKVRITSQGVREGSRRFGQAVYQPAVKLTAVIWLEVMGVFFSLFVIVGAGYCWSHRAALHGADAGEMRSFWMMAAVTVLFGYFCVSSFLRARRRSRQL